MFFSLGFNFIVVTVRVTHVHYRSPNPSLLFLTLTTMIS